MKDLESADPVVTKVHRQWRRSKRRKGATNPETAILFQGLRFLLLARSYKSLWDMQDTLNVMHQQLKGYADKQQRGRRPHRSRYISKGGVRK